ncbi:MAG TPA: polysaccharide biosynthesis/export family protein [Bacteroidales bacterium]|nr:polysaccharide biosynthesis/export family protein [Bacteroidales bacterium]HPS72300.1 polysaccharide biosynthesis/export family protein [Bacteroidales bacterium]
MFHFLKKLFFVVSAGLLLFSCNTSKQILYLQDAQLQTPKKVMAGSNITIQAKDMVSIIVSSKDQELAALFNLTRYQSMVGPAGSTTQRGEISGYTVDLEGFIDFPVVGKLKVLDLTRHQLATLIKDTLIKSNLIKDPVVTVDFMNLYISVMGEVKNPGRYKIERDQITLLDAISMAGDLTIFGKRDGITVIRETNGERIIYKVDIRTADLFDSPVYYLKQNDIIYVEPNKIRAGQSTINENNLKSVSLWISVASLISTISLIFLR